MNRFSTCTFKSCVLRSLSVLVFSCTPLLAADTSIRVVTTVRTNESGSISTKEIFTRNGQTNLVRNASIKSGVVQIRIHRFYHGGVLVGDYVAMRDSSGSTSEAGSPYSLSLEFGSNNIVKSVVIGSKDGEVLDAFSCTNGVFSPVESSRLGAANATGKVVREEMEHFKSK